MKQCDRSTVASGIAKTSDPYGVLLLISYLSYRIYSNLPIKHHNIIRFIAGIFVTFETNCGELVTACYRILKH